MFQYLSSTFPSLFIDKNIDKNVTVELSYTINDLKSFIDFDFKLS